MSKYRIVINGTKFRILKRGWFGIETYIEEWNVPENCSGLVPMEFYTKDQAEVFIKAISGEWIDA